MAARMSMKTYRVRFREESWYRKPQDRSWPGLEKALERFCKVELKKWGGKITKNTSKRDFERFKVGYTSLFFSQVNDFLKRDVGVKNGLFAAMGAGAATLGAGHVYWMKDVTGDDPAFQAEFDAMDPREQRCATHLQMLTRDLMLYYLELVVSDAMRTKLVDLKRRKGETNEMVEWSDAVELLSRQLKNTDTRFLAESIFVVRREDQSALIEWVLFFLSMMKYCSTAAIALPKSLYYTMLMGQISLKEVKHVTYVYPTTEQEQNRFNFEAYRDFVGAMPPDKFPVFNQSSVRTFTKTMLISQDIARTPDDPDKKKDNDGDGKKGLRYCKSCECKHKKGAHTEAGKKRYAAKKKADRAAISKAADEVMSTESNATTTRGDRRSSRKKARCFTCGKTHFPFCPRPPPGAPKLCHVCKKPHAKNKPWCKRKSNDESHQTEVDAGDDGLRLKISQAIAERINELFMMTTVLSDICRATITFVMPNGKDEEIAVSPDSVSSVTIAELDMLHDVHDCDSGIISGFAGTSSLDKAGYIVVPHITKPGAAVLKAYAGNKHLPSGVKCLLSKTHSSLIGADINRLCAVPKGTSVVPMMYDERTIEGFDATHYVVDGNGIEHPCEMATAQKLTGAYKDGFSMIRYNNGAVVVIKSKRVSKMKTRTRGNTTSDSDSGRASGNAQPGADKCIEPTCKLPAAKGRCPKHGGAKQACSKAHYLSAKMKSKIGGVGKVR